MRLQCPSNLLAANAKTDDPEIASRLRHERRVTAKMALEACGPADAATLCTAVLDRARMLGFGAWIATLASTKCILLACVCLQEFASPAWAV